MGSKVRNHDSVEEWRRRQRAEVAAEVEQDPTRESGGGSESASEGESA